MKIKVKITNSKCLPKIIKKGEWIDLASAEDVEIKGPEWLLTQTVNDEKVRLCQFHDRLISLGVAMQLPKGYEAHIVSRSSTYRKYKIILANSMGIIDNTYCGNKDIWKYHAIAYQDTVIPEGHRIAQFRIELSQHATFWQKLKWLFTSKIELVQVDDLSNNNRGGFGSTGV